MATEGIVIHRVLLEKDAILSGGSMACDIAATGVYSVEGQDALANELAFGTPDPPQDDGAVTDGGVAIDTGEGWEGAGAQVSTEELFDEYGHAIEPEVDPHQLAADRIRAELETQQSAEETAQWLEQHEQESAAAEQDAAYNNALACLIHEG
jgi:hypothetical protein